MGDKSKYRAARRRRKRKFTGNQHAKSDNSAQKKDGLNQNFPSTSDCSFVSASARKIGDKELGKATEVRNYVNEGFVLIDISLLCAFISSSMKCEDCDEKSLACSLDISKRVGFANSIHVYCQECSWCRDWSTSKDVKKGKAGRATKEVNLRMVCFARSIGRGHSALENFALALNSPPPMTKKSYRSLFRKVHASSKSVAIKSMKRAASDFKNKVNQE